LGRGVEPPPAADLTQFHATGPPGVAVLLLQRAQGFLHLFLRALHGGGQCRCRQRFGDHHQHRFHRTQEPFVLGAGRTGLAHCPSSSACPAVVSVSVSVLSVPVSVLSVPVSVLSVPVSVLSVPVSILSLSVSVVPCPVPAAGASSSKSSEMVTSPLPPPVQCTVRSPSGPARSKPPAPRRYSSSRARNRAPTIVVVSASSVSARKEACRSRRSRSVICAACSATLTTGACRWCRATPAGTGRGAGAAAACGCGPSRTLCI